MTLCNTEFAAMGMYLILPPKPSSFVKIRKLLTQPLRKLAKL